MCNNCFRHLKKKGKNVKQSTYAFTILIYHHEKEIYIDIHNEWNRDHEYRKENFKDVNISFSLYLYRTFVLITHGIVNHNKLPFYMHSFK